MEPGAVHFTALVRLIIITSCAILRIPLITLPLARLVEIQKVKLIELATMVLLAMLSLDKTILGQFGSQNGRDSAYYPRRNAHVIADPTHSVN